MRSCAGAARIVSTGARCSSNFAYQWERCDGSGVACAPIVGAASKTYTLVPTDVGHTIRVTETAYNAGGRRRTGVLAADLPRVATASLGRLLADDLGRGDPG
jgi:hypothetical protein